MVFYQSRLKHARKWLLLAALAILGWCGWDYWRDHRFDALIAAAARRYAPGAALYVCGGGAHNAMLLAALARLASPNRVATTAALGLDPDYVEAVAFAWFARRTLAGLPSSAGMVTGAEGARILGGVYRHA